MIEHVAAAAFYQASFEVLDRALVLLGASLVAFIVVYVVFVLLLGRPAWVGAPVRTLIGIVGGLALIVLGVASMALAVALLATPLYLVVVVMVLACLGI